MAGCVSFLLIAGASHNACLAPVIAAHLAGKTVVAIVFLFRIGNYIGFIYRTFEPG